MKVAVCYSGLYRNHSGWQENHKLITDHADSIYYSTWNNRVKPFQNMMTFPEPKVEYDPFFCDDEIASSRRPAQGKRRKDLVKQILAHQYMVDELAGAYDIVIRMRYDTWLGDFDWNEYIETSFNEQKVIGFGEHDITNGRNPKLHTIEPEPMDICILMDFIIIHPADKMQNTVSLFNENKLLPANAGWYQVLAGQHNEEPLNYEGGVQLSRLARGVSGLHVNDFV